MNTDRIPDELRAEVQRLAQSITRTMERRPITTKEHSRLAESELGVLREAMMDAAKKYGNVFARRLRIRFDYSDPTQVHTRVSLAPAPPPPPRGSTPLTVAEARKQLEATLHGRSS